MFVELRRQRGEKQWLTFCSFVNPILGIFQKTEPIELGRTRRVQLLHIPKVCMYGREMNFHSIFSLGINNAGTLGIKVQIMSFHC